MHSYFQTSDTHVPYPTVSLIEYLTKLDIEYKPKQTFLRELHKRNTLFTTKGERKI